MLIGLARFSCIVGLVERPLCLSLMAGLATGLWDVCLPLGITLELLWLDIVAMGSIIHPFSGMAFLLLFPLCAAFAWTQPGVLLLPLVLCMTAAHLGAMCELRYRIHQNGLLDLVTRFLSGEDPRKHRFLCSPERILFHCLAGRVLWHVLFYLSAYAVICFIVTSLLEADLYPVLPRLQWGLVYAMAAIGAVLSLRERRAYAVCALGIVAVVALVTAGDLVSHLG